MRNPSKHSSGSFITSCLRVVYSRLHRNDRGAISVLVLLTIWCLVYILAMVWNTTETAVRRQQMQAAADSAAHDSATWLAHSVNAISAQNMVISQDASTETIWRAINPTNNAIWLPAPPNPQQLPRLNAEIQRALDMRNAQQLSNLLARVLQELGTLNQEYQLANDALATLQAGNGANYGSAQEALDTLNQIRQARSAMLWVVNTYINGNPPPPPIPGATARPGPPGPNGEGLIQLASTWKPSTNETAILNVILNYLNTVEIPIMQAFQARTLASVLTPVDQQMAAHEAQVYQTELAMAAQVADTIEQQRAQLAAFYKTDITLATLKNSPGASGPAQVTPPLVPASSIPGISGLSDSIRFNHILDTLMVPLSLTVNIDPINPQTLGDRIWHPGGEVSVPLFYQLQYGLRDTYALSANLPARSPLDEGWGHLWAMPLEHYVYQRVGQDMQGLAVGYMIPLDRSRATLAQTVRAMLNLPANGNFNIKPLPNTLPDDQPRPTLPPATLPAPPPPPPIFDQIPILPKLTAPANASAAYRTTLNLYNQHGAAFIGGVNALRSTLINYTDYFNYFTDPFANSTWHDIVMSQAVVVLANVGQKKQFMVLSTYGLRYLPDWARAGMFQSAAITLEDDLVTMNMNAVTQQILNNLVNTDPRGLGARFLGTQQRQFMLRAAYGGQAAALADIIVRPAARAVAQEIAAEWVNRPWPYEITPPNVPLPPSRGLSAADRQLHFTVLGAARQTADNAPRLMFSNVFGPPDSLLVAYAQADAYNWMEFNPNYGGGERFDQVVPIPETNYWLAGNNIVNFIACPRGWRTASHAGWSWRARLSLSDALYPALQTNSDFAGYLDSAGLNPSDPGALNAVNLH